MMNMNIKPKLQNNSNRVYCFGEVVLRAGLEKIQGNSLGKIPIYVAKHGKITIHIYNNFQHHCKRLRIRLYTISKKGEYEEVDNYYFPKTIEIDKLQDTIVIQDGRHTFPHSGNAKRILHLVCVADDSIFDLDYFFLFAEIPKKLPTHFMEAKFAEHNAMLIKKMYNCSEHRTPLLHNNYSDPFKALFQNFSFGGKQQDHGLNQTILDNANSISNNQVQTSSHQEIYRETDIFDELNAPDPLMEIDDQFDFDYSNNVERI